MKKKIIAIIVAIVLIIPVSRGWYEFLLDNFSDAELASSTQLKFRKISDTEVEVVGYISDLDEKITIPEKIQIGSDIYYKVTRIGSYAFRGCSSLTSIKIPEGVTSIGKCAFHGCKSLNSIKIPKSVTSIGEEAFWGCSNLEIVIDNSKDNVKVEESAFKGCKSVKWLK